MTKIIFLLPPSEWKKSENKYNWEKLSFTFEKPLKISKNVTEKDLKCKADRFLEWLELNKKLTSPHPSPLEERELFIEAINRYSGVMYSAINYSEMSEIWKKYFEDNFLILSGMYWILKPLDRIWNYKLPIDSKWLFDFWWEKIVKEIVKSKPECIINLLPISYSKLLWLAKCKKHLYKRELLIEAWVKIININFLKENWDKISHWVKKIKWEWIKSICETQMENSPIIPFFKGDENKDIIDINIIL